RAEHPADGGIVAKSRIRRRIERRDFCRVGLRPLEVEAASVTTDDPPLSRNAVLVVPARKYSSRARIRATDVARRADAAQSMTFWKIAIMFDVRPERRRRSTSMAEKADKNTKAFGPPLKTSKGENVSLPTSPSQLFRVNDRLCIVHTQWTGAG